MTKIQLLEAKTDEAIKNSAKWRTDWSKTGNKMGQHLQIMKIHILILYVLTFWIFIFK